jgi:APA family basic amino acid/polyamine antiporter
LDVLGELVSIGTLAVFVFVCVGVLILRIREPRTHRPFRTPLIWIVAPLGMLSCGLMMVFLSSSTWIRLAVWTGGGLAIYFLYGVRHAKEGCRSFETS